MKLFLRLKDIASRHNEPSIFRKAGREVLGPMLLGYSSFLHREAHQALADMIAFLSREGRILQRAYELLFAHEEIPLSYIHVSRLSLCRASVILTHSWDELESIFTSLLREVSTLGELFALLGISEPPEDTAASLAGYPGKKHLYELIMKSGHEYFTAQNDLAKRYLVQHGIKSGVVMLSDIGWSGTMQMLLQEIAHHGIKYFGRYLAVNDIFADKRYSGLDKKGFWFNTTSGAGRGRMVRFTTSALETMFLNTEGTTTGYTDCGGTVYPVKEQDGERGRIAEAQEAALDFLKEAVCELDIESFHGISPDVFFMPYINFAVYPSRYTLDFYSGLTYANGITSSDFLPLKGFIHYLLHPGDAFREFNMNNSKTIWLKGLLRIPFPYYGLLCFMTGGLGLKSSYEKRYLKGNSK